MVVEQESLGELLARARAARSVPFEEIRFSVPSFKRYRSAELEVSGEPRFAAVSVTGPLCSLGCEHCRGTLLESMAEARSAAALLELGGRLAARGCRGLLLSGGCDERGRVPLAPLLPAVPRLKREHGLSVVVHAGLVGREEAMRLAEAGVERVMIDLVGARATARRVLHLDAGPERFEASLAAVVDAGLAAVPHVVVGLDGGRISGERDAVAIAARHRVAALVMVVLRPGPRTGFAGLEPPSPEQVGRLLAAARLALPDRPVLLGCARPVGRHGRAVEAHALGAGLDGIAFPSDETVRAARARGLAVRVEELCCALGFPTVAAADRLDCAALLV